LDTLAENCMGAIVVWLLHRKLLKYCPLRWFIRIFWLKEVLYTNVNTFYAVLTKIVVSGGEKGILYNQAQLWNFMLVDTLVNNYNYLCPSQEKNIQEPMVNYRGENIHLQGYWYHHGVWNFYTVPGHRIYLILSILGEMQPGHINYSCIFV